MGAAVNAASNAGDPAALAKSLGWLVTTLLSIVTLPVTRTGIWVKVLGVPFDRALQFHRFIGRATFLSLVAHFVVVIVRHGSFEMAFSTGVIGHSVPLYGFIALICTLIVTVLATGRAGTHSQPLTHTTVTHTHTTSL